eukprot:618966_1
MSLSVFGFGRVGQALAKQAVVTGLKVLAVADSSGAVVSNNHSKGLSVSKLGELGSFKHHSKLSDWSGTTEHFISKKDLCGELPTDSIVADCSASDETTPYLVECQQRGIAVTMANKHPLSASMTDFHSLTQNRSLIRFECTVGAGLPIITSVGRIVDSGDNIVQIQGQLSGTIGFMLSELHPSTKMSEIVQKAKECGYTEPDPRDDLSGMDIARKALILARCMGINIEMKDVEIESLYPKEMERLSLKEFMNELGALDEKMAKKILKATQNETKLRYTAVVTADSVKVGLVEVAPHDALYNLVGTDNLVSIHSDWYTSPLIVAGPGAGVDLTAGGLLSDMYELKGVSMKQRWGYKPK